jgi:hypothetical protein
MNNMNAQPHSSLLAKNKYVINVSTVVASKSRVGTKEEESPMRLIKPKFVPIYSAETFLDLNSDDVFVMPFKEEKHLKKKFLIEVSAFK